MENLSIYHLICIDMFLFHENWFRKNIRSIIAITLVFYCIAFDFTVLLMNLHSEGVDRMVTANNAILTFILGYYYSANHTTPEQSKQQ